MQIFSFDESNKNDYINFVTSHPSGSFLQSWSWGEFQKSQHKEVVRLGISEQDKIVGTVQFIKTKIPHLPGSYLYAPYGPLINIENNEDLAVMTLLTHLKETYGDYWFIRFEPKQSLPIKGKLTQRIQPSKTLLTDISQETEELLSKMHPKNRYNIKVSAKHGVKVISDQAESMEQAVELLFETSRRQNYHSHPKSYYVSLINYFQQSTNSDSEIHVYKAYYENEIVSCAVMVDHGKTRTYLFGGSDDKYRNVMAPYAMHWQAITDARIKGLTKYDWWGIETATGKLPGFVQFKLKWGGDQIAYPPALDIVQSKGWYLIYAFLRRLNRLF